MLAQAFTAEAHALIRRLLDGAAIGTTNTTVVGENEGAPTPASSDSSLKRTAQASLTGGSEVRSEFPSYANNS